MECFYIYNSTVWEKGWSLSKSILENSENNLMNLNYPQVFSLWKIEKKNPSWTIYFKMILRNAISFLCLFFNFVTFLVAKCVLQFFPLEFGTSDLASVLFLHSSLTPLWFLFWPSYHFQDANDPQPWFTSVSYPRIALPVAYSSYIPYAWFY